MEKKSIEIRPWYSRAWIWIVAALGGAAAFFFVVLGRPRRREPDSLQSVDLPKPIKIDLKVVEDYEAKKRKAPSTISEAIADFNERHKND